MSKTVEYKREARKGLKSMPQNYKIRFLDAFDFIAENDNREQYDIRTLVNRPGFRLRIGDYRAIFTETEEVIEVLNIAHRSAIYKKRGG